MQRKDSLVLTDTQQSWWELTAIQFSSWMGIPVLASSILILQRNSFLGAILTIVVGNAIMWFIRLGLIAMSLNNRQSTLDISRSYLGNVGGYFIAILLLASTFAWYIAQTMIGGNHLTALLRIQENPQIDQFTQVSVFLGIVSAFLCMEGIRLLRRLSVFSFPIIFISFLVVFFTVPKSVSLYTTSSLSLSGISLFLATNLGISSDLPTFFRHSQSWGAAIKSLTIIQVLNLVFGILGLYFGSLVINGLEINSHLVLSSGNEWLRYALIIFIFTSVICANVANVYSASVGWEIVAPKALVGRKEYLILGLSLTILFILVSNLISVDFLLHITDAGLVNLCIVLVLGFLISIKMRKKPSRYAQMAYFAAWIVSLGGNGLELLYRETISPLAFSLASIAVVVGGFYLGSFIICWKRRP